MVNPPDKEQQLTKLQHTAKALIAGFKLTFIMLFAVAAVGAVLAALAVYRRTGSMLAANASGTVLRSRIQRNTDLVE